jgi:uncharacterized protein
MRHLLDVNVWVAILDESHLFHGPAMAFLEQDAVAIASCPLVENGVLRVLNLPGYSSSGPVGFVPVQEKLAEIYSAVDHEFWPDSLSLISGTPLEWSRVLGHNQITDAYLLALAVAHDGTLVTLDHRIALAPVRGAADRHLLRL